MSEIKLNSSGCVMVTALDSVGNGLSNLTIGDLCLAKGNAAWAALNSSCSSVGTACGTGTPVTLAGSDTNTLGLLTLQVNNATRGYGWGTARVVTAAYWDYKYNTGNLSGNVPSIDTQLGLLATAACQSSTYTLVNTANNTACQSNATANSIKACFPANLPSFNINGTGAIMLQPSQVVLFSNGTGAGQLRMSNGNLTNVDNLTNAAGITASLNATQAAQLSNANLAASNANNTLTGMANGTVPVTAGNQTLDAMLRAFQLVFVSGDANLAGTYTWSDNSGVGYGWCWYNGDNSYLRFITDHWELWDNLGLLGGTAPSIWGPWSVGAQVYAMPFADVRAWGGCTTLPTVSGGNTTFEQVLS